MGKKTDLKDSCANCNTNCVNLFRHRSGEDKSLGGELYVYKQTTHARIADEELSKHVCSNAVLLQCACYIIGTLYTRISDDYLANICNEIVRDMKASFYLAMSGHYRQAVIIQRCVFENFLYGFHFMVEDCVFQKTKNKEGQNDLNAKFKGWIDGGFRKSEKDLRETIQKHGFISKEESKEWGELFNELSHFVHSILKTPTGKAIKYGSVEIAGCYSEVMFNKNSLIEWSEYYQKVFFLILYELFTLYPQIKKELGGKLALKQLKAEFGSIKEKLDNPYLNDILKMRALRAG